MSETTQKGDEDITKTGNPKRDAMMNSLVEERNNDGDLSTNEEVINIEDDSPLIRGDDGLWYGKRIIDGEEELVPWDDLVADAQKVKASQKRFEEASAMRAEAKYLREEAGKLQVEDVEIPIEDSLPDDEENDEALVSLIKEYHKALYDDEEEQSVTLMKQIRGRENNSRATPVDPNEARRLVDQAVTERLEEQSQQKFQSDVARAQERFASEYEDIANDEVLRGIADQKTVTIMNEHPSLSPWEVIEQASIETREWVTKSVGTDGGRQERKRSSESRPNSAGATSTLGSANEKPQTRSDVIAELKRLRNQT